MHHSISQMKHQLDATLCRFYFCRVTLHVSGASAHHQEYLKLVRGPLVHMLSLQVSHHISLLGPKHVEWLCRNKTCTVLHQVGVSFDLFICLVINAFMTAILMKVPYSMLTLQLDGTVAISSYIYIYILALTYCCHCRKCWIEGYLPVH